MKDILIISHFTLVPGEKGNGRFGYIADLLAKNGHSIEVLTTNFSHEKKQYRNVTEKQMNELSYKLSMVYEPGYKKNVSLQRFFSHYIFGKSLAKYLSGRAIPDLIYCAVPSLDAAYIAAKFAKKNNVRFIIDVQDLWPEAFKMIVNIPFINKFTYYTLEYKANYVYKAADEIIAVSQTYLDRALSRSNKCQRGLSTYLGTDFNYFDNAAAEQRVKKPTNEIWLAYIGTLGHSYDLNCVIDAISILNEKGINNIKLIIMGNGPLKSRFEKYANSKKVNAEFTGLLNYNEMIQTLVSCDIAVNPITKGAAQSIINKVGDYAAAGIPVLNTQESTEYRELLEKYKAGINCKNNNPQDLAQKLSKLYYNKSLREELGTNNRRLGEEKFDRALTYSAIIDLIGL